jgi:aminoglycoside 6'-N-acetyltransferase
MQEPLGWTGGFRPVGVMRRYECDADGEGWHGGLPMDLLAEEVDQPR